ncbi:MAG: hypothetical protein AAF600_21105 [Bacteroidota bacterium]
MSDVIRDFKKFTFKRIHQAIKDDPSESRRAWLLKVLSYEGKVWFWEEGYHGEEIHTQEFCDTKANYIHLKNPLKNLPFGPTLRYSKFQKPHLQPLSYVFEILKALI